MELHFQGLWFESEDVRPPLSHAETGNGDANHHEKVKSFQDSGASLCLWKQIAP